MPFNLDRAIKSRCQEGLVKRIRKLNPMAEVFDHVGHYWNVYGLRRLAIPTRFQIGKLFDPATERRSEIFRRLRMFGIQLVEQGGQCGTLSCVVQNSIPTIRRKFTGAQRGNVQHELAAGCCRQLGDGFLDFEQRLHVGNMRQWHTDVNLGPGRKSPRWVG